MYKIALEAKLKIVGVFLAEVETSLWSSHTYQDVNIAANRPYLPREKVRNRAQRMRGYRGKWAQPIGA